MKPAACRNILIIGAFFFLLVPQGLRAGVQSVEQLFSEANSAYRSGNYKEAFSAYQSLAKTAPKADIFYNLGNAAFKNRNLGLSIVNYERARRLRPRDPDILENLKFAKSLVEYRVDDKRSWYHQKLAELLEMVKLEELMLASLSVYLIFAFLIFFRLLRKKQPVLSEFSVYVLAIFLIVSMPLGIKFYATKIQDKAIVTAPQLEVRFAPSERDKTAFRLVEGISVTVVDEVDDWLRITLVSGDTGWVRKGGVEIV